MYDRIKIVLFCPFTKTCLNIVGFAAVRLAVFAKKIKGEIGKRKGKPRTRAGDS